MDCQRESNQGPSGCGRERNPAEAEQLDECNFLVTDQHGFSPPLQRYGSCPALLLPHLRIRAHRTYHYIPTPLRCNVSTRHPRMYKALPHRIPSSQIPRPRRPYTICVLAFALSRDRTTMPHIRLVSCVTFDVGKSLGHS